MTIRERKKILNTAVSFIQKYNKLEKMNDEDFEKLIFSVNKITDAEPCRECRELFLAILACFGKADQEDS